MKYLILLFILLLPACAAPLVNDPCPNTQDKADLPCYNSTLISVYADDAFTEDEKIALANAFSEWSIKTENTVRFDILFVPTESLIYTSKALHTFYVFKRAPEDKRYIGYTMWTESRSTGGAAIEIKPKLTLPLFRVVVLHEIGHALWLHHYEGPLKSIMYPSVNVSLDISCRDLKDFCDKWHCHTECVVE